MIIINKYAEKYMKKRKAIILIMIVLVIALLSGFIGFKIYANNKEKEKARIARKYEKQNYAFGMAMDPFYKGYNDINPTWLLIRLSAFREDTDKQTSITTKDIEDYLENEYDASGNLAVLNPPENIQIYLKWFWSGGGSYISDYYDWLRNYLFDYGENYSNHSASQLSEEEFKRFIEEFDNSPYKEECKPKALKR